MLGRILRVILRFWNNCREFGMEMSRSLSYRGRRHLPLPSGPYGVGCTDIMTGHTKNGSFFRLFYPTIDSNAEEHYLKWTPWIPSDHYVDGIAAHMGVSSRLFHLYKYCFIGDTFIPAQWEAPISQDGPFPVIVFSHGLAAWRNSYSTMCLEFASHGFIVAAVEHRDNSACASYYMKQSRMSICGDYPGSSLKTIDEALEKASVSEWQDAVSGQWEPRTDPQTVGPQTGAKEWIRYRNVSDEEARSVRGQQVDKRVQECCQLFSVLRELNKGSSITNVIDHSFQLESLTGQLDMKNVAIMGHSFGGATAILCLTKEPQFRIGIVLDPWMFPLEKDVDKLPSIKQPLLAINSEHFQSEKHLEILKNLHHPGTNSFYKIRESIHRDQSDVPFIGSFLLPLLSGRWSREIGFMTHTLIMQFAMQFISRHLERVKIIYTDVNESLKEKYVEDVHFQ